MSRPYRKCFGTYFSAIKICRELCNYRDECRARTPAAGMLERITPRNTQIEKKVIPKVIRRAIQSNIFFPCNYCGEHDLIKYGKQNGRQRVRCRSCNHISVNPNSPPGLHHSKTLYEYALTLLRRGTSLRRTATNIKARFGKSIAFRTLGYWAEKEGIPLPPRAKYERDGHRNHIIRAKRLLQKNEGIDWNLAQALVSKEDEIRDHLNAERDRINIEDMIDTFNKIYA